MPKFEFPIGLPQFTTEEFEKRKADHIAKYGYVINVPAFSDIIHLGFDTPPNEAELELYRKKKWDELSKRRRSEIANYQRKKRDAYLRMLATPTPGWLQNIGSALNFLDDVNDALGTAALLARFTARLLPKAAGRLLTGPAGWALLGAEIVGFLSSLITVPIAPIKGKRMMHDVVNKNPFSKKAAVARARKLRRTWPTKGEIIEALQTTDQMFGIGICLGPIIGNIQDLASGLVRSALGQKVTVRYTGPPVLPWMVPGYLGQKAAQALLTEPDIIDDETYSRTVAAAYATTQTMNPYMEDRNPLDKVDGLQHMIIKPQNPLSPSTMLLLEEEGIDYRNVIGYPQINKKEATYEELWDASADKITDTFHKFTNRNKNTHLGLMTSQMVNDCAESYLALAEGPENVVLDYDDVEKVCHKLLNAGYTLSTATTPEQNQRFAQWVYSDPIGILNLLPMHISARAYENSGVVWIHESKFPHLSK